MGIVIRQSVKATLASYLGVVIGAVNLLILFPIFLKPEEIGLRDVLIAAGMFSSFFIQMSMNSVSVRFFPYFKDEEKGNNGFLFLLLTAPLLGYLFFLIVYSFFQQSIVNFYSDNARLFSDFFYYLLPLAGLMAYAVVLESYCRVNLRITVPNILREIWLKLAVTGITLLYGFGKISLEGFLNIMVLSYLVQIIGLVIYIVSLGKWFWDLPGLKTYKPLIKEIGIYILWMMFGSMGVIGTDLIDRFMLSKYGLDLTGIYSIAFFMAVVVEMPKRSISQISGPIMSQAIKDNNVIQMEKLYKQTALNQFLAGIFIFSLIWISVDHIFELMANTHIYSRGKYVVLFIGIAKLIDMSTGVNADIIQNSKYYRFNLILILLLAIVTVYTNYMLIPIYGLAGAALATAISVLIYNIAKCWFVYIKYKIHPFTMAQFKGIALFVVFICLFQFLPVTNEGFVNNLLFILWKSILVILVFLFAIFKLKLSNDFIEGIKNLKGILPFKK